MYPDRLGSIGKYYPYGTKAIGDHQRHGKVHRLLPGFGNGQRLRGPRYQRRDGRFLTSDRMTGNAADPGSWNKYAYVAGDPINRVDPGGTDDCEVGGNVQDCYCAIYGTLDPNCDPNYCPPGICGTGGPGGTNPPQKVPCYDDLGKIQELLTNLIGAVYDQFANDSRLSLQQKVDLGGVLSDAGAAEVDAIEQYMQPTHGPGGSFIYPSGPDPAYYKGGHFNLIVDNGPGSELAGRARWSWFRSVAVFPE